MSHLLVISETGIPHSACLFNYTYTYRWVGFHPAKTRSPLGIGELDFSDRSQYIKFSVGLSTDDMTLKVVMDRIISKYQNAYYTVGVNDCINLAVDAANWCGFKVPPAPNMVPDNLVKNLISLNLDYIIWEVTK